MKTPDANETNAVNVTTVGNTATFKLNRPITVNNPVPLGDGWYDASVRHSALTPDEVTTTFSFLNADFDNNRAVNISDFNILSPNFGKTQHADGSPMTFAEGDANYDGVINIGDFNILSPRFEMSLPGAPTQAGGVAVGNTTAGKLDVIWNADPAEFRNGFKIYRSDDGGNTFFHIGDAAATDSTWQDPGSDAHPLVLGEKYWYRVRSYTTANGANASVTKAWGIPTRPTAAIADLYAAGVGPGRISVKWNAPAADGVKGYRVYRSTTPDFLPSEQTLITATDGRKTRIIDSGLSPGHTYYYRVVTVGLAGSLSAPSLAIAARAQNDGPGLSNSGTPFDPATHDSDGDGTVDAQDVDNDNDGILDTADDDDDNDGIIDRSEPDDRDTDLDGTPDNQEPQSDADDDGIPDYADPDDDNDGIPDDEDPSSGKLDEVPTGPGTFDVFSTLGNNWRNGYTPDFVDFSYSEEGEQETTDENGNFITEPVAEPRMAFWDDHLNVTQTFTFSNLPKHTLVSVGGIFGGGGWLTTDPTNPGRGVLTVKVNGQEIEYPTPGGYPQWYIPFGGTIESDSDQIEVSISATNFDKDVNGSWDLGSLSAFGVSVTMPTVTITADTNAIEEGEQAPTGNSGGSPGGMTPKKIKFTAHRDGPTAGDLKVKLDWKGGKADSADVVGGLPSEVTIPKGADHIDFDVEIKDDPDAEGTEDLVVNADKSQDYVPAAAPAKVDIQDNVSVNDVTLKVLPADATHPMFNEVYGYAFRVEIEVHGENVQQLHFDQKINRSTTWTSANGTQQTPADDSNSNGFIYDTDATGAPSNALAVVAVPQTNNGVGHLASPDQHGFTIGPWLVQYGNQQVKFGLLTHVTRYMKGRFFKGPTLLQGTPLGPNVDWGYTWSNWNTIWRPTDTPTPPAQVTYGIACEKVGTGKGEFSNVQSITGLP